MIDTDSARKFRLMLDLFERAVIVLLFAWLCYRIVGSLEDTPFNIVFLLAEGAVALFVLLRRPTDAISVKPFDWVIGITGTMLPMLLIPSGNGWIGGAALLMFGTVISLGAKFSLRRSFGVVAANRGIKSKGLYGAVRHPMYLGYFLSYTGMFILNPSLFNAALLGLWGACQIARIHAEEQVLLRDAAYRAHAQKVRFRLMPYVY